MPTKKTPEDPLAPWPRPWTVDAYNQVRAANGNLVAGLGAPHTDAAMYTTNLPALGELIVRAGAHHDFMLRMADAAREVEIDEAEQEYCREIWALWRELSDGRGDPSPDEWRRMVSWYKGDIDVAFVLNTISDAHRKAKHRIYSITYFDNAIWQAWTTYQKMEPPTMSAEEGLAIQEAWAEKWEQPDEGSTT